LSRNGRKALIPFIMAGDPDLMTTEALLPALAEAGADLIEIGIPFSDPLADGPVIQRAASRALAAGTTPQAVLARLSPIAHRIEVPLVLLTYWNPVMQYGRRGSAPANGATGHTFAAAAAEAGVSGVIIPDLPPEEAEGFCAAARQHGLATIFLAAPTSPPARLRRIARSSEGFIYYVSLTGTTGVRDRLPSEWLSGVRQLKRITTKPICVGFGISTPAHAAQVARIADGVIVGSALVKRLESHLDNRLALIQEAQALVRQLRSAT
jgi:tryptophan synthase alpha chain